MDDLVVRYADRVSEHGLQGKTIREFLELFNVG
jgi:hypothetical protein